MRGADDKSISMESEDIKKIFKEIAPFYDAVNAVMTFGLVGRWRYHVLRRCAIKPGDSVLDVCTGTGEMAVLEAWAAGRAGQVIGLDNCPEMLEIARRKWDKGSGPLSPPESPHELYSLPPGIPPPPKAAPLPLTREANRGANRGAVCPLFMEGDALDLPFEAEAFDCVTTVLALRNLGDFSLAIREMARVCKKGGRVVCLDISEPVNIFLKTGFRFYFHGCIPTVGKLLGRPEYTWLSQSLRAFPPAAELQRIMQDSGLSGISVDPLSGGVVTLYAGVKR